MNTKEAIKKLNGALPDPLKGCLLDDVNQNDWFDCDVLGLCIKTHYVGMIVFMKYEEGELYLIDDECKPDFFQKVCTVSEFLEEARKWEN